MRLRLLCPLDHLLDSIHVPNGSATVKEMAQPSIMEEPSKCFAGRTWAPRSLETGNSYFINVLLCFSW
jgi:hypothetical protein